MKDKIKKEKVNTCCCEETKLIDPLQQCFYRLYSRECSLNEKEFTIQGIVLEIVGRLVEISIIPCFHEKFKDKLDHGIFSVGTDRYIFSSGDLFLLILNRDPEFNEMEEFTITISCDKTINDCKNKFNNEINFPCFPYSDSREIPNLAKDEKHEQDIYPQQLSLFDERNYWCNYFNVNWKKCNGVIGKERYNRDAVCSQWNRSSCPKF